MGRSPSAIEVIVYGVVVASDEPQALCDVAVSGCQKPTEVLWHIAGQLQSSRVKAAAKYRANVAKAKLFDIVNWNHAVAFKIALAIDLK